MHVYTVPERYRAIVENAIRKAVEDAERDQQEPGWVPDFAIDGRLTGTLVIMVAGVSESKMAVVPAA